MVLLPPLLLLGEGGWGGEGCFREVLLLKSLLVESYGFFPILPSTSCSIPAH